MLMLIFLQRQTYVADMSYHWLASEQYLVMVSTGNFPSAGTKDAIQLRLIGSEMISAPSFLDSKIEFEVRIIYIN